MDTTMSSTPHVIMLPSSHTSASQHDVTKRRLKSFATLAYIQLSCAIVMLLAEGLKVGLYSTFKYYYYSMASSFFIAVWGSIYLLVTASFGVAFAKRPSLRCIRMAYLVLGIVGSVIATLICLFYGMQMAIIAPMLNTGRVEPKFMAIAMLTIAVFVLSLILFITLVVSASYWCSSYCTGCCTPEDASAPHPVVYIEKSHFNNMDMDGPLLLKLVPHDTSSAETDTNSSRLHSVDLSPPPAYDYERLKD